MRSTLFAAALLLFAASPAPAQFELPRLPGAKAARKFADVATVTVTADPAQAKPGQLITVKFTIEPKKDCYTYPVHVPPGQASKNLIDGPHTGDLIFVGELKDPEGAVDKPAADADKFDRVYKHTVTWELSAVVSPEAKPGKLTVPLTGTRLQACNAENCFPLSTPPNVELEVLPGPAVTVPAKYEAAVKQALAPPPVRATPPVSAPSAEHTGSVKKAPKPATEYTASLDALKAKLTADSTANTNGTGDKASSDFGSLLAAAAFWGLISLVTPCVFPMIPITVSLFLKQSHQSSAQVLKLAGVYCLTIIVVLGASAVFLLSVFRELSVDPYMNIFLGGLFVFFALSLFGMYDITLPGFLLRFTEKRRGAGGLIGTVFGALAFSIVSFTCVAPFLGGFAGMAASGTFSQWELMLAGLTFATAFASPFFVLALFPSLIKKLPRSGGWLDTVKVVMGFLELAAAFKFFRTAELRMLPHPEYFTYDVVLAGWVAIAIAAGLYLLNLYRLPHDEEQSNIGVLRLLIGLAFLGAAVYLAPAMLKTGGPGSPSQRPTGVIYAWVDAFLLPDSSEAWETDLPAVVDRVRQERASGTAKKPLIFVDFTGVTCTNCRYNEQNVFPKPDVKLLLERYTLVQMYTDEVPASMYAGVVSDALRNDEAKANLKFQREVFGTEQLPLYAILEPQLTGGVRVVGIYDEGKINDVPRFVEFLRNALPK